MKSLLILLKLTLRQLTTAILIALGMQISDPYIAPWFTALGLAIPTDSEYGTLLATIIGVGSVFIGLYYAAISVIGGAIYSKVPNNIRDLLAQEQIGNVYMSFLSMLTFLGVCLLAFHTAGLKPIILAVPIFLVGAGFAIIAFVRLGTRAFQLFDPTTLSYYLFRQLRSSYRQMQAGGYRWSNHEFQKHSHQRAQNAVDTLTTLSDLSARETHLNSRPFADLCIYLLTFLFHYETAKKSIPTDSLWYGKQYVHTDWYRTDDSTTSISHKTATTLQPRFISNPRWIESALLPIVQQCIELSITENRYTIAHELIGKLDIYVQQLAKECQVTTAFQLIRDISSSCENLLFAAENELITKEPLDRMGICDQLATMPMNVFLAYIQATKPMERDLMVHRLQNITWKTKKSIYRVGFPIHVLEQLEWLYPRLNFEKSVERKIVSPIWYLQELITQANAENFAAAINCFHAEAQKLYEHWSNHATLSKHPWLAAVFMSRESEYWNKVDIYMHNLNQLWLEFNAEHRLEGLPWPQVDFDVLKEKKVARKRKLLKLMSGENILLSLISRPESHPDFAGQFLHTVGEALFTAMYVNDCGTVQALFKSYLHGCHLQFEQQRPKGENLDRKMEIDIKIAVAPLLDMMDISGYVFLFSEYHNQSKMKEIVVKEWDNYLDKAPIPRLKLLALSNSFTESALELPHRSILRTEWRQAAAQRLKNLERRNVFHEKDSPFTRAEAIVVHKSPLVRIFARESYGPHYDGIDIFLAKYVRKRKDGKKLNFGFRRERNLEDILKIEDEKYKMSNKA